MKYLLILLLLITFACGGSDKNKDDLEVAEDLMKVGTKKSALDSAYEEIERLKKQENSETTDKKDEKADQPRMSKTAYKKLERGWKDKGKFYLKLGDKVIKPLPPLKGFKIFTVEQFWDACSTFEYAIIVDQDSSYVNAFPYSVIESGCDGSIDIHTRFQNDSVFEQVKRFTTLDFLLDTITGNTEDTYHIEVEELQIKVTNEGSFDTLSYSNEVIIEKE